VNRSVSIALHRAKGWVARVLGRATADRHVEAEGAAEQAAGRPPTDAEIRAAEHDVKARQSEIVDRGRG
jgi:uncharacterized protein YjbJ (UPF0337 family)